MPSLPAYTPLPAPDDEKPAFDAPASTAPLPRKLADEAARVHAERDDEDEDETEYYSHDQPSRTAAARAALCTALVAFVALSVVGWTLCGSDGVRALGRAVGCGGDAHEQGQRAGRQRLRKRQASGQEQFSTTTYLGDVTTYVKTTRPIVNAGGYTFATLTGYVPVPTTTSSVSASAASSSAANSSSAAPAPESATVSTSASPSTAALPTVPTSSSSSDAPASASTAESVSSPHVGRQPWASLVASLHAGESASDASALPNPSTGTLAKRAAAPEPGWDMAAVDAHSLHRRMEDFEATQEQEATTVTTTGTEEFSTSTNRQGGVVTLVKTTRPIVNPGGYVIGTLDGAWVDVAKQTDRTTLPPAPSSTARSASSTGQVSPSPVAAKATTTSASAEDAKEKRRHDELKRRNVVAV
ncbi:hypothetical protein JCM3770_005972 [Rhodotorula araucariae]